MKKKAQAAMEFLMTYGWAILVVLVVIGALAYFGVLSPKKLLPDKCLFGPGIGTCNDFQALSSDGKITIELTNGLGENIIVTSAKAKGTFCASIDPGPLITDWAAGEKKTFIYGCTKAAAGDKTNEAVEILYTRSGSSLSHSVSGQIAISVQ